MDVGKHPFFRSSIPLFIFCLLLVLAASAAPGHAQPAALDATSYRIYTETGEPATLDTVVAAMDTADVVFIGETHADPTAHALHRTLFERAHRRYSTADTSAADAKAHRAVALSLEMFERDVQPILDEYLAGLITEAHFLASSRPWPNYRAAYRPLVEYAKAYALDVLAANAPRRYVNRVARLGPSALDSLSHTAKQWLPPLPPPAPSAAYREQWEALVPPTDSSGEGPHGRHGASTAHLLRAQALWDATMAHAIATHLMSAPGALVLHVTGGFHVSGGTGTPEQLARYRPGTHPLIVYIRPTADVDAFDPDVHRGRGDFVVLTDAARVPEEDPVPSPH